ncbi:ovochymase-2-like [Pollicipes pollicipes]|uniref:ovochymase-2-like n=1 Tax=Pollicipes pollicipes TaxID=41117 RepID=UPI001884DF96|nr:ovochymase-2-like [Pollicipes pollicipes]
MGVGARAQLGAVLLLTLTAWLADAVPTANSNRPDILPTDCGRRTVRPDEALRPFIVGPGNTTAYYGQYPWQARLVMYDAKVKGYVHYCGGIIVSHEHVVTAAHCVVEVAPHRLLVRVGDLRFDDRELFEQEFAVASYHVHSRFGAGAGLRHDVALLRLRRRVGPGIEFGRYVQPACLPAAGAEYETFLLCEVSGWGRMADLAPISEVLRGVSVPLVSDAFCGAPEVYQDRFLPGAMFCSGPTGGGADSYCPDLLPADGEDLSVTLNRPLCGLDAANTPLLCCPGQKPRRVGCGRSRFSPPSQLGAAFAKNAANFPWMAAIYERREGGGGHL